MAAKTETSVMDSSEKMKRTAFANQAFIGQLYDARTERLGSDSLFSTNRLPDEFLQTQQNYNFGVHYSNTDLLSDRFNLLNIEPELQLHVLLGHLPLKGHHLYLCRENPSKVLSCSLLYKLPTVSERLIAPFSEMKPFIDETVYENDQYTHVIVDISWGLNYIVTLRYHNTDAKQIKNDRNMLKAKIRKLGSIFNGDENCDEEDFADMEIKILADDVPDITINNRLSKLGEFFSKLPEFLKSAKEEKGVPLYYTLIPISTFRKNSSCSSIVIAPEIKSVDESFVIQLVYFFEELETQKQKLTDLEKYYTLYQKYFPLRKLESIRQKLQSLSTKEEKLKKHLAEDLLNVRTGKTAMKDLLKKVERSKLKFNLVRIEDFLNKFKWMKDETDYIDICSSKNVTVLGRDENLDDFFNSYPNDDFYVIYISKELKEKNTELFEEIFTLFFSGAERKTENEHYILVDLDINVKSVAYHDKIKIIHFKGGQVISGDVSKDLKLQSTVNIARLIHSSSFLFNHVKPFNRVVLKMQCPGTCCSNDSKIWTCSICKEHLEYGFDHFFYCGCGKATIQLYEFKCSAVHHGTEYLPAESYYYFIEEELKKLKPLKEMNILILGQSGVGKSTWINSIVNYLQYDTLHDAEKSKVFSVIPANFTVTYMTGEEVVQQVVEVGDSDHNEVTEAGKSATQGPKTYNFILSDRAVRLIDTPGLGDTSGIDRDKENMKKVLDHISHLKEIHGICILLKANEVRIDALFRFCILELLTHLHKNAARNILFCFTKSRSSFYSPGDTSVVLNQLLKEYDLKDMIKLDGKRMFCLDNEAFRFLCTLKYPNIPKTPKDYEIYEESWTKSVIETKKLFEQIKILEPHVVTDTTTLCKARSRILNLTKPIAEISQIIQMNLASISDKERQINDSRLSLNELLKDLQSSQIELQRENLPYPRTVCTSAKCVKYHKLPNSNLSIIEYTTVCHEPCELQGVVTDSYPQSALRNCMAMNWGHSLHCSNCGCSWHMHMHITYIQTPVEVTVTSSDIEKKINDKRSSQQKIEEFKHHLEQKIKQYEEEQEIIIDVCVKFGRFLKENAIAPFNDGFKDYLEYLIQQEENKVERSQADEDLLKYLRNMMKRYVLEAKILEESINLSKNDTKKLTIAEIIEEERKLYDLKLTGDQIKKSAELSLASVTSAQNQAEQQLPIKSKSNQFFNFIRSMRN